MKHFTVYKGQRQLTRYSKFGRHIHNAGRDQRLILPLRTASATDMILNNERNDTHKAITC